MILAAKGWRFHFTFLNLFSRAWTPWPATSAGLETSLARAQYIILSDIITYYVSKVA